MMLRILVLFLRDLLAFSSFHCADLPFSVSTMHCLIMFMSSCSHFSTNCLKSFGVDFIYV